MEVRDALDQLDRIHDQLTKAEVYRGFRVPAVALVGCVGLLAAAAQRWIVAPGDPAAFVWYWSAIGASGVLVGLGAAVRSYLFREDDFERRRTRRVMGQFLPCVLAGGFLTMALGRTEPFVLLLPGVWAMVFGLGVIAVRPHLPRGWADWGGLRACRRRTAGVDAGRAAGLVRWRRVWRRASPHRGCIVSSSRFQMFHV